LDETRVIVSVLDETRVICLVLGETRLISNNYSCFIQN
jgi:hypothetical protein